MLMLLTKQTESISGCRPGHKILILQNLVVYLPSGGDKHAIRKAIRQYGTPNNSDSHN